MHKVGLTVNGTDISMNAFVQRTILNLLLGILKSLTLDEEPKEAVFRISELVLEAKFAASAGIFLVTSCAFFHVTIM